MSGTRGGVAHGAGAEAENPIQMPASLFRQMDKAVDALLMPDGDGAGT